MNDRLIPEGGENPYKAHPGFSEQDCELQYVVTPSKMGSTSMHGFGCSVTGGHCVKDEHCESRREMEAERQELDAAFKRSIKDGNEGFGSHFWGY